MRTRIKFVHEALGFTLSHIKRVEVKFDPLHPNSANIREFYAGIASKKVRKSNPECLTKYQIVSDRSDPLVTIRFEDNHKLAINAKHLESNHIVRLIKQFREIHKNVAEEF